jgi:Flp pilus assembly protein TadG
VIPRLTARLNRTLRQGQRGSAIIEFIFVALLVLIPLVYVVVAVAVVQRSRVSMTDAARDVGRAIGSSASPQEADRKAAAALRIALANHAVSPDDVELRYVPASADCSSTAIAPDLTPGAEFAVCVTTHQDLPGVPSILSGRGVTLVGRFVVHVDEFRLGVRQ